MNSVRIIAATKTLKETIPTGLKLSREIVVNINDKPQSEMSSNRESQSLIVGA